MVRTGSGRYCRVVVMGKHLVPAVVFVDADSSRLAPALGDPDHLARALAALADHRITVVLCSHQTRAEVEGVRQALGIFHPFVCERGAVACIPERYFGADPENTRKVGGYHAIEFGEPYERVVETLRRVSDRVGVALEGFSGMSVAQVSRACGMSLLDARLAKLREYSEPFRLVSSNPVGERRLFKALESAGLTCAPFGTFQCAGSTASAASAAAVLTTLYRLALGGITVAAVGGADWASEIGGSLDLTLPPPAGAPPEWLDSIIQNVVNFRDTADARPVARYAR